MMENDRQLLGVIGGLGPMATVYFYELITQRTKAECDQDHIDILISSRATTPDRTSYILGRSDESPLPAMKEELKRLEEAGITLAVMPCNTAHYFIDGLKETAGVPMLDIIEEAVRYCVGKGYKRLGLFATEGTVSTGSYQKRAEPYGVEIVTPDAGTQEMINDTIYGKIKKGLPADADKFALAAERMREAGCENIILGCTELSLVKKQLSLGEYFTDSMETLADATIKACGKEIRDGL